MIHETDKDFIRQLIALAWTTPKNSHKVMDVDLAEAVVEQVSVAILAWKEIATNWKTTARDYSRSSEYYQSLLDEIGNHIGYEAHVADDGSYQEDILRAKLPDLVKILVKCLPRLQKF